MRPSQVARIEEAIQQNVRDAADPVYDSLIAGRDGQCVGVALLRRRLLESAELHLIAVVASERRTGVGRLLVERAASELRSSGAKLFSVHTVGPSLPGCRLLPDEGVLHLDGLHSAGGAPRPRLDGPNPDPRDAVALGMGPQGAHRRIPTGHLLMLVSRA